MNEPHAASQNGVGPLGFALLTVSDTRTPQDDVSGGAMRALVANAGHRIAASALLKDDAAAVREQILAWALDPKCEVIVSTGGTGLSARDRTVEAVGELFDVRIEGFGELFRHLSFEEIGSRAMLSRAAAGIVRGTPVFLLPGSPNAVALALERLILPEIGHVVGELRRHGPRS